MLVMGLAVLLLELKLLECVIIIFKQTKFNTIGVHLSLEYSIALKRAMHAFYFRAVFLS